MNVAEFVAKWKKMALTERSAAQQHFLDLCEVLDHPKPAAVDPTGESFTFEKGAAKQDGGGGWADVWKRGYFGWEYKGKHKDLDAAYKQLLQYREALENPPLLVVCDMDRIILRTNFTNTPTRKIEIPIAEIDTPQNLGLLRAVFYNPDKLRPGATSESITVEAARRLAEIANALRGRGLDAREVARFLDRIVFCLFAQDIGLLPPALFTRLVEKTREDPARFTKLAGELFAAMAHGGDFGLETIRHFNGNLFNDGTALDLTVSELERVRHAAKLDWGAVDPSILGTLFERGLDPAKRSQLGAHYTSRQDIETIVEPVVMQPMRREWAQVRTVVENLLLTGTKRPAGAGAKPPSPAALKKGRGEADILLHHFLTHLATVKILDPACGSGNFLYVTLQKLKDLEKEVIDYALSRDFSGFLTLVGPWQLHGIELNPYAYDLAQMTVWIGYLQWMRDHGYLVADDPVLRSMDNFQCMDAVLDLSDPEHPTEPEWPTVDFIVGNPPFLGDKVMRRGLGHEYVEKLRAFYGQRLPGQSDYCCYWFEKARQQIEAGRCKRAGLLATQGIRGGQNRETLKRIKATGDIFFAVSDRNWILEGANVHVSMVGFDSGAEQQRQLDGHQVQAIHANLSGGDGGTLDITQARPLSANAGICYLGVMKAGPFDIPESTALSMLSMPNPHGRPNSDVLRPRLTARDILHRSGKGWIIDFGCTMPAEEAAFYEQPWEHVVRYVKPEREGNRSEIMAIRWWLHGRSRPDLRQALAGLPRFIVTPEVSKHRIFLWLDAPYLADHQTRAFARADDCFFGILHSRIHEVWSRAQGTQLRESESGFRYTPTSCFETFPLPESTTEQEAEITLAACELDRLRNAWLNPPEWTCEEILEFPGSANGPWARYVHDPDDRGIGTVRYPRLVPRDAGCATKMATRTLTDLYNQRPGWLDMAHRKLDSAVFAAYGWEPSLSDEQILQRLLALNHERSAA